METFGKHQGADDPKQPFRPTSSPKRPSKMKCPATYSKQCSLDDFTNKHCRPHPKQPPRGGPNQPLQLHTECRPQHELGPPSKKVQSNSAQSTKYTRTPSPSPLPGRQHRPDPRKVRPLRWQALLPLRAVDDRLGVVLQQLPRSQELRLL